MSDPRHDAALVTDMLEYARDVVAFAREVKRDELTRRSPKAAVLERWIEVIGESARGVSDEFRDAHPQVPWRQIIATRHILAHDYGRINYDVLWRIVTIHLPELIARLEPLVPTPPLDPEPS